MEGRVSLNFKVQSIVSFKKFVEFAIDASAKHHDTLCERASDILVGLIWLASTASCHLLQLLVSEYLLFDGRLRHLLHFTLKAMINLE